MKLHLNVRHYERALRIACVCALVALGLIVWSLLDPRALPVVVAMSVGQVLGTLSLLVYVIVVVADLRRVRIEEPPSAVPSEPPAAAALTPPVSLKT